MREEGKNKQLVAIAIAYISLTSFHFPSFVDALLVPGSVELS
jgi:hypothetical protein